MVQAVEVEIAGRTLRLETGRMAKLADGAVLASYGDTVVLATAVASKTLKPDTDFLPLTVNYQEKAYSAGKIPGGYFKREGAPSEKETLTSRLIDRPIRPLIPERFYYETQVIASVLSVDQSMTSEVVGITAASAALTISDIPFGGPLAGVRIGHINGQFVVNPNMQEIQNGELDLVVAGTADAIMMVESGANGLSESILLDALALAHSEIKKIVAKIVELQSLVGGPSGWCRLNRSVKSWKDRCANWWPARFERPCSLRTRTTGKNGWTRFWPTRLTSWAKRILCVAGKSRRSIMTWNIVKSAT